MTGLALVLVGAALAPRGQASAQTAAPATASQESQYSSRQASFYQPLTTDPAPNARPTAAAPIPLPLAPRGERATPAAASSSGAKGSQPALWSVAGALAAVLGVFALVVICAQKYLPRSAGPLPKEVVESLGFAPLDGKGRLQLLRLGNKLVLVALSPQGAEPLAEVTEAAEVERLTTICRRDRPGSISATFRNVLSQLEQEPVSGFVGPDLSDRLSTAGRGGRRA